MQVRRRRVLTTLAVLSVAAAAAAQAANASTSSTAVGWAATATHAESLANATTLGLTSTSTPLTIDVALKAVNVTAEAAAVKAMYTPGSSTYDHFLTPAQFTAAYAPSASAVSAVTSYLSRAGFSNVSVMPDNLLVTASGTVADAEKAFHTSISNFSLSGKQVFANTAAAEVPTALASIVSSIIGLDDVALPTPTPALKTATTGAAGTPDPLIELPPKDFQNTYEAAGTPAGTKTSIALLTEGDVSSVVPNLRLAEKAYGLPQVTVSQVNVGPQSTDTSGTDEFDLDTQSSTAMAGNVKHLYMDNIGSLVDASIVADFAYFFSHDQATAMSASIGGCDIGPYLDGSLVTTDELEEEGAMQGQTLFASSGDNGDACEYVASVGAPVGAPGTNWPASGEFTTAVGGTSLLTDAEGNRVAELGWVGSGGGISEVENPGWWTQDSDPGYTLEDASGGRAVPDVALDADPNTFTAAAIYVDGAVTGVGGTSLASPLMLGAWSRLETAHGNDLGLASIDFYRLYDAVNPGTPVSEEGVTVVVPSLDPQPVKGLTDIVGGTNGAYTALPGYDEVTGIGAPNILALDQAL